MATSKLTWKGKAVQANVQRAAVAGINKTLGACVETAKGLVHTDTTVLQGSLRNEPAQATPSGAEGRWGSFDVGYALWQEILPNGGKPYLRPAADTHYRDLGNHIRASLA